MLKKIKKSVNVDTAGKDKKGIIRMSRGTGIITEKFFTFPASAGFQKAFDRRDETGKIKQPEDYQE